MATHPIAQPAAHRWFDAHLDLAYLEMLGRDMTADPANVTGPDLPAAVTLPSLAEGAVTHTLATIFTEPRANPAEPGVAYDPADPHQAHHAGVEQLNAYHRWVRDGMLRLPTSRLAPARGAPLTAGILIENADPIASPEDLEWWRDRGVVAIGMAWWADSRYAAGNGNSDNAGVTDLGRALVAEADRLGITHDASHLSQRAVDDLFDLTDARIIASHSNARALLGDRENKDWQRHVDDRTIRSIAARDGVIGLNLALNFITYPADQNARPTIANAVDHVCHICDLTGSRAYVGLGSDMDGGFSAARLPGGINRPADLERLTDELASRGFSDEDIGAFRFGNWARIFPHIAGESDPTT